MRDKSGGIINMYTRYCPQCNNIIYYKNKYWAKKAEERHTICSVCRILLKKDKYKFRKFGHFTILDTKIIDNKYYFICECRCGIIKNVLKSSILNHHTKSCGCVQANRNWQGCGELSKNYFTSIKSGAISRNLEFSVTIEQLWDIFVKQDRKCALTQVPLQFYSRNKQNKISQTASLDRIDNNLGYTINNVWWVHKDVNQIKMDFSLEQLYYWCNKISKNKPKIEFKKPNWYNYFLGIAYIAAQRSHDVETKHGCVITNAKNNIISTGYNGFPRGINDNRLPNTRPNKYEYMIHAEINAVINASQNLDNCTAWVTGESCNNCLTYLWQAGISKVVCNDKHGSQLINGNTRKDRQNLLDDTGLIFELYDADLSWLYSCSENVMADFIAMDADEADIVLNF